MTGVTPPDLEKPVFVREFLRLRYGRWETVKEHRRKARRRKVIVLKKAA